PVEQRPRGAAGRRRIRRCRRKWLQQDEGQKKEGANGQDAGAHEALAGSKAATIGLPARRNFMENRFAGKRHRRGSFKIAARFPESSRAAASAVWRTDRSATAPADRLARAPS